MWAISHLHQAVVVIVVVIVVVVFVIVIIVVVVVLKHIKRLICNVRSPPPDVRGVHLGLNESFFPISCHRKNTSFVATVTGHGSQMAGGRRGGGG